MTSIQKTTDLKFVRATLAKMKTDATEAQAPAAVRSTIATRKAALTKAVKDLDMDTLSRIDETAKNYVDNIATIDTEPHEFMVSETVALAQEYKMMQELSEFLDARKEAIRQSVFGHVDTVEGPNAPGEVIVESEGITLRREGAGYADPTIDVDALVEALGEVALDLFETTEVPEVVIPAHTERKFSEDKLIELAATNPAILDIVGKHLVPGKPKSGRFVVRKLEV